jgi:hypothetical protein
MPTFLILQSPNKGNIGTTTEREEGFYKPTFYQISEQELAEFTAMSQHAKNAFIAEKLEAQMGMPEQVKKKIAPIVEVVESREEKESVENKEEIIEAIDQFANTTIETITENKVEEIESTEKVESVTEKPKAKGRPKKVN